MKICYLKIFGCSNAILRNGNYFKTTLCSTYAEYLQFSVTESFQMIEQWTLDWSPRMVFRKKAIELPDWPDQSSYFFHKEVGENWLYLKFLIQEQTTSAAIQESGNCCCYGCRYLSVVTKLRSSHQNADAENQCPQPHFSEPN